MAHLRNRALVSIFRKKMKLWPAVCLFGPRQCGKTTFLKDIIFADAKLSYFTFDKSAIRRTATKNPEAFLSTVGVWPLVIDEAQKVPEVFDEIKALIDEKRIPGRFILSGSVKFSKKVEVREALTGRSAHLYLDTMNFQETLQNSGGQTQSGNLAAVHRYLERGGMPGVCFLHSKEERHSYWEEWLDTTCEIDLKNFSKGRLSSDLARQILEVLAIETQPEAHVIAKKIGVDTRRVQNHLDALKDLFLLREITPHPDAEQGKSLYYLFDSGLVHHLGGPLLKRFESYFLTEYFFYAQKTGDRRGTRLHYYRTRGGLIVNFLTKDQAFFFSEDNHLSKNSLKSIHAAQKRLPKHQVAVFLNSGQKMGEADADMRFVPWAEVCQSFRTD